MGSNKRTVLQSLVILPLLTFCLLFAGCQGVGGTSASVGGPTPSPTAAPSATPSPSATPTPIPAGALSGVLKWKNDLSGKGLYDGETVLTPGNVNVAGFGKLASFPTDGLIVAQPLFVNGLNMGASGVHNVVIIVNEHDSVYA